MGPAKDKHGVRESNIFIHEEWPFPDKGILIKTHIYNISYVTYPISFLFYTCTHLCEDQALAHMGLLYMWPACHVY